MLIEIFIQGGWVMWPILAASVVALGAVINRLAYLVRTAGNAPRLVQAVLAHVRRGEVDRAKEACARSRVPAAAVLRVGLEAWGLEQEEVERRMEQAAEDELARAEARLPLLATMIAVLPMLGFLGTILGLIDAFFVWSHAGAAVTIEQLAKGIAEAMITTGGGLVTSIPYVVAYNVFAVAAARVARSVSSAGSELAGAHRMRAQEARVVPVALVDGGKP
ncbi:MAG TPA: MotA/TolQ/ExbB proton channel family protein [Myxococcaceae bacterium]|jgi:biopolymer transport protein ExbB